jgi:hypothetical protein
MFSLLYILCVQYGIHKMVKVKQASLMCFKPNTELYVGRQNVGRVEGLTSPF